MFEGRVDKVSEDVLAVAGVSEATAGVAVVRGVEEVKVGLTTGDEFKFVVVRAGEVVVTTSTFQEYEKSGQTQYHNNISYITEDVSCGSLLLMVLNYLICYCFLSNLPH